MAGELRVEKAASGLGITVPAANEHAGGDLVHAELTSEHPRSLEVERLDRPHTRHSSDGTEAIGRRNVGSGLSQAPVYARFTMRRGGGGPSRARSSPTEARARS